MKEITNYNNQPFKPFAKLNFYLFNNLILNKIDANSLELSSSTIDAGELYNNNFTNVSFLSSKFIATTFSNCNMQGADMCSLWNNDCKFIGVDFSNSTITNSIFINCTFENCMFESITLTNTEFVNCIFEQFPVDSSTITLNTFKNCTIKNTSFTESFYYQIFENCEFINVQINPMLLGYNFGFSKRVLTDLIKQSNLEEIEADFINNYFLINAAILHINLVDDYHDLAILGCVKAMCQMIRQDILVKNDEIQFLKIITEYLNEKNAISQFVQMKIWQCLTMLIENTEESVAYSQALPYIREYANEIYFRFQKFQNQLQVELNNLPSQLSLNKNVEVEIIYSIAPAVQLVTILEQIRKKYYPNANITKLNYAKQGSFIENFEVAEALLPYFSAFISLLGCITPFIINAINKKDKMKNENDKNHHNINVDKMSAEQITNINSFNQSIVIPHITPVEPLISQIIANVTGIIIENGLNDNADFYGYNNKNIKSITITFENPKTD